MFVDMFIRDVPMDPQTGQMAKFIVERAARMSALIEDLLSFARTGVPQPPRRVDLRDAVAQATENLAPAIQASGATVTLGLLPVVLSNQIHLVRVFQLPARRSLKTSVARSGWNPRLERDQLLRSRSRPSQKARFPRCLTR
jgi:light-regulated signal transduction histidine kinase (bacteriophytochrome)